MNILDRLANGTPKEVQQAKEQILPTGVVEGLEIIVNEDSLVWLNEFDNLPPYKLGDTLFLSL